MNPYEKWQCTDTFKPAAKALDAIIEEMKNPTYAQVSEVLDCMRDFAEYFCVFTFQKLYQTE